MTDDSTPAPGLHTRRSVLVTLAALLPGCTGDTGETPTRTTTGRPPTGTATRTTPEATTPTPTRSRTPTRSGTPTGTATPGREARTHRSGTAFTVGAERPVSYEVTAVDRASSLGTGYGRFRPDGVFLLVAVDVRNVGDRPVSFERTDFSLVDAAGETYPVDSGATARLPASRGTPHRVVRELSPGGSAAGWLVFDVPAATGWRLRVDPPDASAPPHDVVLDVATTAVTTT